MLSPSRSHLLLQLPLPPTPRRSFARSPQCPLASDPLNLTQGVTLSLVAPSASHSPSKLLLESVLGLLLVAPGPACLPCMYSLSLIPMEYILKKPAGQERTRRRGPFPQTLRKRGGLPRNKGGECPGLPYGGAATENHICHPKF